MVHGDVFNEARQHHAYSCETKKYVLLLQYNLLFIVYLIFGHLEFASSWLLLSYCLES